MDSSRKRRVNGLERPYSSAQISTWIFLPTLLIEFGLLATPLMELAVTLPVTIYVFALAIAATYYGYQTMKVNPADPRLGMNDHYGYTNGQEQDEEAKEEAYNNGDEQRRNERTKQCFMCNVQVHESSMHCKFCNKCVEHFDHHCMWLNTCVGRRNYYLFRKTMNMIIGFLIAHCAVQVALILDMYLHTDGPTNRLSKNWFFDMTSNSDNTMLGLAITMGIFCVLDLIALSLMLQLFLFHMKLQRQGLSTYQFIIKDNQRRREARLVADDRERTRASEMHKAMAEKQICYLWKLKLGGCLHRKCGLGCCDPLQPSKGDNNNSNNNNGGP